MRTTVTFDDDTAAAVNQLRTELGIGVSAAVNELLRKGLGRPAAVEPFVQQTSAGNARMDVTNIAEVLDLLDVTPG